ncbi:MAG: hypothetical protein QNJ00_17595 [Woeseiaceae bacterium]|nr:hypothetical protein [Woeseiaceae bacterium]
MRPLSIILVSAVLLSLTADAQADRRGVPAGFDQYLVYMATGTVPFASHPNPAITGCGMSLFCDGDYFHRNIMGRTTGEIEAEAARAKEYFSARFGVNVDDLVAAGRLRFFSFFLDPRGEYRAYTIAGKRVPASGWVVRDGGFAAEVVDPAGIELAGEFAGLGLPPIPMGGLLVFGDYNILATSPWGKRKRNREIVISYRSDMPMIANNWGELVINCQLSTDDFEDGTNDGKAQGMGTVSPTPYGLTLNWRNVLTIGEPRF